MFFFYFDFSLVINNKTSISAFDVINIKFQIILTTADAVQ